MKRVKKTTMTIYIEPDKKRELDRRAKAMGLCVSTYTTAAIMGFLASGAKVTISENEQEGQNQ